MAVYGCPSPRLARAAWRPSLQHAGLVGEVLRIVRTATQLDPTERFKTCEDFESAIAGLLRQVQGLDGAGPRETPQETRG